VPFLNDPALASGNLSGGVSILGFIGRDASVALPALEKMVKDAETNRELKNAAQQATWAIKRIRGEAD
jgi:hypothetical protein